MEIASSELLHFDMLHFVLKSLQTERLTSPRAQFSSGTKKRTFE